MSTQKSPCCGAEIGLCGSNFDETVGYIGCLKCGKYISDLTSLAPAQPQEKEKSNRCGDCFSAHPYNKASEVCPCICHNVATEENGWEEDFISRHNARILNEFQLQGNPDTPIVAYDERVCLLPAMKKVREKGESIAELSRLLAASREEGKREGIIEQMQATADGFPELKKKIESETLKKAIEVAMDEAGKFPDGGEGESHELVVRIEKRLSSLKDK